MASSGYRFYLIQINCLAERGYSMHPMRHCRSLLGALAALAAMTFAQASIAAASWEAMPSPCHQPTPNVCAAHCDNNDLTPDTPRIKLPAAVTANVTIVAPAPRPRVVAAPVGVLPAGPPPRILFQSFLI
jgi:hypothetical protein